MGTSSGDDDDDITINTGTNAITSLTRINAVGDGDVTITAASIADDGSDNTEIGGDVLTFNVTGDIGGSAANAQIDTDATSIVVTDGADDAGNVYIGDVGSVTLTDVYSDGAIAITAQDSLAVANVVTSGDVTLTAGGAISESGADAGDDISGAVVTLTANNGGIGVGNAIELNAATRVDADSSAASGDIFLSSTGTNDLKVGAIDAGSGDVNLNSVKAITDENVAAVNVTGNDLNLVAAAGIDLDTTVSSITSQSTGRGRYLPERDQRCDLDEPGQCQWSDRRNSWRQDHGGIGCNGRQCGH